MKAKTQLRKLDVIEAGLRSLLTDVLNMKESLISEEVVSTSSTTGKNKKKVSNELLMAASSAVNRRNALILKLKK